LGSNSSKFNEIQEENSSRLKGVDSSINIGSSISCEYDRRVKANGKWNRNIVTGYHGVYTHHKWILKLGVPKRT
jgi:hypothetical protein